MNKYINKIYNVTEIEQNIIVGSLLGDGNLALYGRSKNSYYREHGCDAQMPNTILEINKKEEIIKFINIVKPYIAKIPCMKYKIDLEKRFEEKKFRLKEIEYTNINSWTENVIDNSNPPDSRLHDAIFRHKLLDSR